MSSLLRVPVPLLLFIGALFLQGCSDDGTSHEKDVCGNGIVEHYEECDDGNDDPNDGCHQCRLWEPPSGEPFTLASEGTWEWYPVDDAICRDGSPAGLAINVGADLSKVMVFFEGGGACFEALNCAANPYNITEGRRFPPSSGIFDRHNERNPYRDWTFVHLPYCTGDVFAGRTRNVVVKHLAGEQQFVGDFNMRLFLDRLVPTLPDVKKLSLVGISAGGMSAVVNTKRLAREFPDAEVTVLDDGGPPLSTKVVPACLQEWWTELWELDQSVLADCGAGCPTSGELLLPLTKDLVKTNEKIDFGLFSFRQDATVRLLFSFGQNNCGMLPIPFLSGETLEAGLIEFREEMRALNDRTATYFAPGESHVCVTSNCFYTTYVDGVGLAEWTGDLLDRKTSHVGD